MQLNICKNNTTTEGYCNSSITRYNTKSTGHVRFCGLLTKNYLSKVVQQWTMKHGETPAHWLLRNRYKHHNMIEFSTLKIKSKY